MRRPQEKTRHEQKLEDTSVHNSVQKSNVIILCAISLQELPNKFHCKRHFNVHVKKEVLCCYLSNNASQLSLETFVTHHHR